MPLMFYLLTFLSVASSLAGGFLLGISYEAKRIRDGGPVRK